LPNAYAAASRTIITRASMRIDIAPLLFEKLTGS
jgi:hypothetical protein